MYRVEVRNTGDGVFKARARENEMVVEPMGKGFGPAEVLLASLGSCMGLFIRKYAEQSGLGIKEFSIRLESDWSQEKPMALRRINVQVDLKGAALDARRKEALRMFVSNCPIKATLAANPDIDIAIT